MEGIVEFLARHGYLVLFGWVLVERLGAPLPAVPVLLAAGAMSRGGGMSLTAVLALPLAATLLSDAVWYEVGRRRGGRFLAWLCRISLEPDSCVRRTQQMLGRQGARPLLYAKFVPGLNVAAVPMAGMLGLGPARFLLYDAAGALAWVLAFTLPGYLFADRLETVGAWLDKVGRSLVWVIAAALAAWLAGKALRRRLSLRGLRVERIEPEDLRRRMEAGEDLSVVDLRHAAEVEADPATLPGALRIPAEELEARHAEIPRDRDVILLCT